jgi:general secretion pathway protein D
MTDIRSYIFPPRLISASLTLTFAFSSVFGQAPTRNPAAMPTTPATVPLQATPAAPTEAEPLPDSHQVVVFVDEGAGPVLDFLERLTGKIILRPQNLPQIRVSFDSRGPISREEAILAMESLLVLNGIMIAELGGRFLKAAPATNVNQQVPELLIGPASDLPSSQRIFAKVFPLSYLQSGNQGLPVVQPLLSATAAVVNIEKSNALLITDALVNLQRVEAVLRDVDRPQTLRGEFRFITLQHIGAEDIQRRLEALVSGPLKSYVEGNVSITSDERTNQLILYGAPENLTLIETVIAGIDIDAAPLTQTEVFYMRQAQATAVVTLIESVIAAQEESRQAKQAASARQASSANEAQQRQNQAELALAEVTTEAPAVPTNVVSALVESSPSLQFSPYVGLAADERTNSIVAYGTRADIRGIRDLVEKIDIPLPQVRIEAIITEVTLSDNEAFGLERFGFTYNPAAAADLTFGGPLAVANSDGGITGAGFDLGGSLRPFTLQGVIEAAESTSEVRVLSTPSIVVSHNEEAVINVSEARPIITGSTTDLSGGSFARSTVQFRDIGINLTVTPLIGSDGTVQMVVEQTVENVIRETMIDGNQQPIIGRREARSTISVQDRDIIILGGLQENRRSMVDSRWPIVGRIPVVGRVFGGEKEEFQRTELIIFLRPTILPNPAAASAVTRDRLELSSERKIIKDFLESGSLGDSYLEGSRIEGLSNTPDL